MLPTVLVDLSWWPKVEACLGVAATGRNLNTVNKLKAMVGEVE